MTRKCMCGRDKADVRELPFSFDDVETLAVFGQATAAAYTPLPEAQSLLNQFDMLIAGLGVDGRIAFLRSLTLPPQAMMEVRNLVIESKAYDMDLGVIATMFDGSEFEIMLGDLKQYSSTN